MTHFFPFNNNSPPPICQRKEKTTTSSHYRASMGSPYNRPAGNIQTPHPRGHLDGRCSRSHGFASSTDKADQRPKGYSSSPTPAWCCRRANPFAWPRGSNASSKPPRLSPLGRCVRHQSAAVARALGTPHRQGRCPVHLHDTSAWASALPVEIAAPWSVRKKKDPGTFLLCSPIFLMKQQWNHIKTLQTTIKQLTIKPLYLYNRKKKCMFLTRAKRSWERFPKNWRETILS